MLKKKLHAGALQYVLIISTIILIVLLTFVQLISLQKRISIKNNLYKESILNVSNGFFYLSNLNLAYNEKETRQLSENEQEKTTFLKKKWGAFDLMYVKATLHKESFEKVGLIGNTITKKRAIYLTDNNTPLVLVGNTTIIGDAYLPKSGVKRGNISGTSFYGNYLINGNIFKSTATLPSLKKTRFNKSNYVNDSIKNILLKENDNITQSFYKSTLYYQNNSSFTLANIILKGNIIVESNRKITIDKSAQLEDIIIIAPEIEVKPGVTGNFQLFATKKIHIQKNCTLHYPSAIILNNTVEKLSKESILIEQNNTINGIVVFDQKSTKKIKNNFVQQIKLNENATITGEVYCNGNLELLGAVIGEVYTKRFITKQFGSVYINHIYHGKINASSLPESYAGLGINSKKVGVSKWLY